MKRRGTGVPVLLLLATWALLPQVAGASSFTLFGSYFAPDDTDEVLGLGVHYTIRFNDNNWAVDVTSGIYDGVEVDLDGGAAGVVADELRIVPLDFGLRYTLNRSGPQPYFGGGASFVRLNSDAGGVEDEWGWYGLLGIEFGDRRGPKFVVEGTFRELDDAVITLDPTLPESAQPSVSLSGFSVNVGLSWTL